MKRPAPFPLALAALAVAAALSGRLAVPARGQAGAESENGNLRLTFDFTRDAQGWTAGFANYPAEESPAAYVFQAEERPLGSAAGGYFLAGENRGRNFTVDRAYPLVYLKRQLTGLAPGAFYVVTFEEVEFRSTVLLRGDDEALAPVGPDHPFRLIGRVEAGVSTGEPANVELGSSSNAGHLLALNVRERPARVPPSASDPLPNYGSVTSGDAAVRLGSLAVSTGPYPPPAASALAAASKEDSTRGLRAYDRRARPLCVKTDANGACWIFVGNDLNRDRPTVTTYRRVTVALRRVQRQPRPVAILRLEPPLIERPEGSASVVARLRASYTLLNATDSILPLFFPAALAVNARIRDAAGNPVEPPPDDVRVAGQIVIERFLFPGERLVSEIELPTERLRPGVGGYTLEVSPLGYAEFLRSVPLVGF